MRSLAGAALALALSAVGPVASASADNWHIRRDWLRFPAPVNYTNCKIRHVQLNGRYDRIVYYIPAPSLYDRTTVAICLPCR
jgi:hypothetical protein